MAEIIRLRRRVRALWIVTGILVAVACYGYVRPGSGDAADALDGQQVSELQEEFSVAGRAERVRMLHQLGRTMGQGAEQVLIGMVQGARTDRERLQVIEELGRIGSERAVEVLAEFVGNARRKVELGAIAAMGRIGSDVAVEQLLALLDQGPRHVQNAAVGALGRAGTDTALSTLVQLARADGGRLQLVAVAALGESDDDAAVDTLKALVKAPSERVWRAAVAALGQAGSEGARRLLLGLAQEGSRQVRLAAVQALGSLSGDDVSTLLSSIARGTDRGLAKAALQALGAQESPLARQALLEASKSTDQVLADAAVNGLAQGAGDEMQEMFTKRLQAGESSYAAASALAEMNTPDSRRALVTAVTSGTNDSRGAALNALRSLHGEDVDRALGDIVKTGTPRLAGQALAELASRRGKAALPDLIKAAKEGPREVRRHAIQALAKLDDPRAKDLVFAAARGDDHQQVTAALNALANMGGAKAEQLALDLFKNGNTRVVGSAAHALSRMGGDKAREALLSAFRDQDNGHQVIWPLSQMRDAKTRQSLERMLDDTSLSNNQRRLVVQAMSYGSHSDALVRAAGHSNEQVAKNALNQLGRVGGATAEKVLMDAFNSGDKSRRQAALHSLSQLKTPKAVDALVTALSDKDLANTAGRTLASLGSKKAMHALASRYRSGDANTRKTILTNMAGYSGGTAKHLLLEALDDRDQNVAATAAGALAQAGDRRVQQTLLARMQTSSNKMMRYRIASNLRWNAPRLYKQYKTVIDKVYSEGY